MSSLVGMKNQIIIISAVVAILATAILVGTYNIQTVDASSSHHGTDNFGQNAASVQAQANDGKPGLGPHNVDGGTVSNCAHAGGHC